MKYTENQVLDILKLVTNQPKSSNALYTLFNAIHYNI